MSIKYTILGFAFGVTTASLLWFVKLTLALEDLQRRKDQEAIKWSKLKELKFNEEKQLRNEIRLAQDRVAIIEKIIFPLVLKGVEDSHRT